MKANQKVKKSKSKVAKKAPIKSKEAFLTDNSFDFGGLPEDVDLKKNLGCGG